MAKAKKKKTSKQDTPESISGMLAVPRGRVHLAGYDTRATPGFTGDKQDGKAALAGMAADLAELQERLYAEGRSGGNRSVLLVLQGMDTSGKGGVLRHVGGLFDPQGVHLKAFGPPTAEERRKGFLWRIRQQLPGPGRIGVFDRSHYEDVLVARVRNTVNAATIAKRYDAINKFEQRLVDNGTVVVKVMLHISPAEQEARLLARLDDPTKHWKYDPGDLAERALWPQYQEAYETALQKCNTSGAPWLVVPADRKWYRNWAIASVLLEVLTAMDLQWPPADFDVEEQRRLLAETRPGTSAAAATA